MKIRLTLLYTTMIFAMGAFTSEALHPKNTHYVYEEHLRHDCAVDTLALQLTRTPALRVASNATKGK